MDDGSTPPEHGQHARVGDIEIFCTETLETDGSMVWRPAEAELTADVLSVEGARLLPDLRRALACSAEIARTSPAGRQHGGARCWATAPHRPSGGGLCPTR